MKPRDLTKKNWDVNVAVYETAGLEARVTFDCTRMWLMVDSRPCRIDVLMPIKDFRKAVKFVENFQLNTLTPEDNCKGHRCGTYYVEVCRMTNRKRNRFKKNVPIMVVLRSFECDHHVVIFTLNGLRKMIRWYNTDV